MNDKFHELAKNIAQSVARRTLKKLGLVLAGSALVMSLALSVKSDRSIVPCCNPSKIFFACSSFAGVAGSVEAKSSGAMPLAISPEALAAS